MRLFRTASLALRTTVFVSGITLAIATLFCLFYYDYSRKLVQQAAQQGLREETRLVAQKFANIYEELDNDAFVISQLPPIDGLMASLEHDGTDPGDGSTTEQWRNRLETIFASLLRVRPHYTQLRYIGIADGGREIVRVEQRDGEVAITPPDRLQQKLEEPYFQAGLALQPGETYFSRVTYNREYGAVDATMTPTLRTVVPVFGEAGRVFGLIVINVNYEKLLGHGFATSNPSHAAYAINNQGDYISFDVATGVGKLEFHKDYSGPPSELVTFFQDFKQPEGALDTGGFLSYFVKLNVNPANADTYIGVAQLIDKKELLAAPREALKSAVLLSLLLVGIVFVVTLPIAGRLAEALRATTRALQRSEAETEEEELALLGNLKGELGELARASMRMATNLSESRATAKTVLENVADGILTLDETYGVTSCNRAAESIFGYDRDDLIGQNITQIFPQMREQTLQKLREHFEADGEEGNGSSEYEMTGRHSDGRDFPAMLAVRKVDFAEKVILTAVVRDITERKRYEAERENLIAKLVRSNQELESFAHIAAHDLKEPLRAIFNHSSFLIEDCEDQLDASGKKRIYRLQFLAKRMEKLVSDLLHYSRLGQGEASSETLDLCVIVDDIAQTMKDEFEAKNVELKVTAALPSVRCNRVRITEMFRNLITNAIKYNRHDTKVIEIGYDPACDVFRVSDNGIGIDKIYHDTVFKLFKRLETSSEFSEGTGSGLTFVEKIIHQHGGRIWLESDVGQGTTFYFTLAEREAA